LHERGALPGGPARGLSDPHERDGHARARAPGPGARHFREGPGGHPWRIARSRMGPVGAPGLSIFGQATGPKKRPLLATGSVNDLLTRVADRLTFRPDRNDPSRRGAPTTEA